MNRTVYGNPRAVIATALSVEFDAVVRHMGEIREARHPAGTIYEVGDFRAGAVTWSIAVLETGPGNPMTALEVERAIQFFNPSCVLFVGIAGGIKDVAIGDVVAATKIYGYESGKAEGRFHPNPPGPVPLGHEDQPEERAAPRAESEFRPRPVVGESSYSLVQLARSVVRQRNWVARIPHVEGTSPAPKAYVAPIAAGEKVVASTASDTFSLVRSAYGDSLAVDMEGYGFGRAIYANASVAALLVRGISDLVDGKAAADAGGSHEVASRHAAAFAFEVLSRVHVATDGTPNRVVTGSRPSGEPPAPPADPTVWRGFADLAAALYPRGPTEREIWKRAGGDIAALTLGTSAKAEWFAALTELRLGGGGDSITVSTLLREILLDYPRHGPVADLAERFRGREGG